MHPAPFKIFEMTLADGSSLIQEIPTEKHFFRCEYFTFGDKKAQMLENKHLSFKFKKHETGFEPATLALARRYSTTEPLVHNHYEAGDGNRTHVSSLEGWCSTIELHPQVFCVVLNNKIYYT